MNGPSEQECKDLLLKTKIAIAQYHPFLVLPVRGAEIYGMIKSGSKNSNQISVRSGLKHNNVSTHLKRLEEMGFIKSGRLKLKATGYGLLEYEIVESDSILNWKIEL